MEALKSFISNIPYPYKLYFFFDIILLFCIIISLLLELIINSFDGVKLFLVISLVLNGSNFLLNFLTKYDYSSYCGFKIILNFILYYFSLIFLTIIVSAGIHVQFKMVFFYILIFILTLLFGCFVIVSFFISCCCYKKEDNSIGVKNLIKEGLIEDDGLENQNKQ